MKPAVCATYEEQLAEWVEGRNKHAQRVLMGKSIEECCPDFSCCKPHLAQPPEVRRAFVAGDQKKRNWFLGLFLGAFISDAQPKADVHIISGRWDRKPS